MLLVVGFLAIPRLVSAQPQMGNRELLLDGQVSTFIQEGGSFTFGQARVNLGYFMRETLEVGGGPSVFISGGPESTSAEIGANVFLRKFLSTSRPAVAPFIGAEIFVQDFAPESGNLIDRTFLNAIFGLKNYFSERAALEFTTGFGLAPRHPGDFQILQFKVGIAVLLGN
jgi:hypothetical protein